MSPDTSLFPTFLEAAIAAFSILGGVMITFSGFLAAIAVYWTSRSHWSLAEAVDQGIARGFAHGALPAIWAFIIVVAS